MEEKKGPDKITDNYVMLNVDPIPRFESVINSVDQSVCVYVFDTLGVRKELLTLSAGEKKQIDKFALLGSIRSVYYDISFGYTDSCQVVFSNGIHHMCYPTDTPPGFYQPTYYDFRRDTIRHDGIEFWVFDAYHIDYTITEDMCSSD